MTYCARRDRDSGASAVEFALVVPILIGLVVGIVDYGLYFADRLAVTQGIREGARRAVVTDTAVCTSASLDCLATGIRDKLGTVGGASQVQVSVLDSETWAKGASLRVCVSVTESGLTGLTPVPDQIRDSVTMVIEHSVPANALTGATGTPAGGWSWCA